MDVSVVSGTYNRLPSLKRMVETARNSSAHALNLEFVLVDGGSTDGTVDWIKTQSDVRLIEHGRLLGAVKAFNDGAFLSDGTYVILANDDIEFLDQSILVAYIYMQINPNCGMGCFFQDRERQGLPDTDPNKWQVEKMPCVENDRQVWRPYGQVCIVPKWLGDEVGWWGGYLHTYGGDNELTSQVYELGFKVSPIPNARISDHEVQDELRTLNNHGHGKDPKRTAGYHPDSYAWGKKWQFPNRRDVETGRILTGPTIKPYPLRENPIKMTHRIVYLPIFEQGWAVQKEQKRGLRDALRDVALVAEYDYMQQNVAWGKQEMLNQLIVLMDQIQPTLFLGQIHNAEIINHEDISFLKHRHPQAKFINWNGDFWPQNLLSEGGIRLAKSFDLQLIINREVLEKYREMGITSEYWQIGWEPDGIGYPAHSGVDIVFLASGYSPSRKELVRKLRGLPYSFDLYGPGWSEGWAKGQNLYNFKEACSCYRGAKISIGDSQWPESGFVSNRVFQALAAGGSALAHQHFRDMDKLGLIDGKTCIIWKDFPELEKKIGYYLRHEDQRKRIAESGERLALTKHSFSVRVQELLEMLNEEPVYEGWR